MKFDPLPYESARRAGTWDNARRWYPDNDLMNIPGAFCVRSPSRAFPNSYLKHYHSSKFAKLLAIHNPKKYFELSGVDPKSDIGKLVIAAHARKRMEAK